MSDALNRRSFITGAVGCAIVTVAACPSTGMQDAFASEGSKDEVEEVDTDIVVVGGGAAGLTAAIQATELGARVTLLEKTDMLGGNARMTEGIFGLGSPLQQEKGINIPVGDVIEEEMTYTNFRSWGPLLHKYFSASGDNIQWLLDEGVQIKEVSNYRGVSSFDCFHWWEGERGALFLDTLAARAKEAKVDIRLLTAAEELVFGDDGSVTGVVGYNSENDKRYRFVGKAVILASGGFAADLKRVGQMTWIDTDGVTPYGANDGAGIRLALSAGCGTSSVCGLYKTTLAGEGIGSPTRVAACFQPLLMVNETGVRFAREDLNITSYSALYFNAINSQRKAFSVLDSSVIDKLENEGIIYAFLPYKEGDKMEGLQADIDAAVASGNPNVFHGETLDELAAAMGVAPATFAETVARYNEACEKGFDEDFGKGASYLNPVVEGPFYAFLQTPAVYVTIGGIDVDIDNQVVTPEGAKIPGLFSAGVDCCKLYRETYNYQLSGGMIGYCIYSGRVAARTACADL